MLTRLGGMRNITMPNFFQNWSILSKHIAIFRFSKWPLPPSFIFKITNYLANDIQRIKNHEHVKFWQNRSINCEDINSFQYFKMAGDAILIFKFVKFHWQTVSGRPRLIIVLNVVKIGRLLWRHCNFSNFQNGRRRHLGFLK